jgi:glycosyltransferase involved in cell wall biosynthesis
MTVPRLDAVPPGATRPQVSIVLPTYRRPHLIGGMVDTILAQTHADFELIVMEDAASGTETAEALARFRDGRLRFLQSREHLGIPGILNALIRETRGEYVIVLHDHDACRPALLERLVAALEAHPSALYAHMAVELVDADGRQLANSLADFTSLTEGGRWQDRLLADYSCPVTACCLVRRAAYQRFGLYDPSFGFIADVEMWFRLAGEGDVAYVPEILLAVRERGADHPYAGVNWRWVEAALRIHARYRRRRSAGWRGRLARRRMTERYLIGCYLGAVRPPELTVAGRAEGRRLLRAYGGPVAWLVSVLR